MFSRVQTGNLSLREAVYRAHHGLCFYTSRKLTFKEMRLDHVVPRKRGGIACFANLVPTCTRLNVLKKDHVDIQLVERMLYINRTAFAPRALKYYLKQTEGGGVDIAEAARELGRLGGLKGGRFKSMTAKERSDSARKAVNARWAKYRARKRR